MAPAPRTPVAPPRRRLAPAVALLASLALAGCATAPQQTAQTGSERVAKRNSMQAMLQLAARTESSGNAAAAREMYGKVAARYPDQPAGYLGLGRTSYRTGAPAEAAQHYRTALTYAPDSRDARYGLGKALLASNRPEAAIEQFDRLIAREAADTRPYVAKGVALDMIGRHGQAQTVYRSGLEPAPMNVALRTNLGLSLALAGEYKTAPVAGVAPVDLPPRRDADRIDAPAPDAPDKVTSPTAAAVEKMPDPIADKPADTPKRAAQPAGVVPASFAPQPAPDHALAGNGHSYSAQVAALRSPSEAEAEWRRLKGTHGDLLADLPLNLQKTDLPDKGFYYRLRSGPFADAGTPKQLCEVLHARDQACIVVRSGPAS